MDKIYYLLKDKGYNPIYNKYNQIINTNKLSVHIIKRKFDKKKIYDIRFWNEGKIIIHLLFSRKSSVIDFINNY